MVRLRPLDPSETAAALFDALRERRWSEVTNFVEKHSGESHRRAVLSMAQTSALVAAAPARESGEAPVDAEPRWELRKHGVSSDEQLEALDAREMMVRYLEVEDRDWIQPARERGFAEPVRRTVIGHVLEGDDAAHVVYRLTLLRGGRWSTVPMSLEFVRGDGDAWCIGWSDLTGALQKSRVSLR